MDKNRQYLPSLADLIDALSIFQIKIIMMPENKESFQKEIKKINHDIELIINAKKLKLSLKLTKAILILAQMNLHIWMLKEQMKKEPGQYLELLKKAHQLNGLRNRMKNLILEENDKKNVALKKTNTEIDGLKGWGIDVD